MKSKIKLFLNAALVLVVAMGFVSCKSTGNTNNNQQFSNIYNKYKSALDLTNAKQYVVQSGDRLSKIAAASYGSVENAYYFPLIMAASSDVVLDPDLIAPGMKLTVPDLQINIDSPNERASVKLLLVDIAKLYKTTGDRYPATQEGLMKLANSL